MTNSFEKGLLDRGGEKSGQDIQSRTPVKLAVGLGLVMGIVIGLALSSIVPSGSQVLAIDPRSFVTADDGTYSFFPFRRNLWVVRHESSTVQFYMFPSAEGRPIQPSQQIHNIDRTHFPVDQVVFSVSDVNLTSHLWMLNPITGKARYVRALRDGTLDVSEILPIDKEN